MQATIANPEPVEEVQLELRLHAELWTVELEVEAHAWVHSWTGYAADSIEATQRAKLDFFGSRSDDQVAIARYPLRVRSCMQVGV